MAVLLNSTVVIMKYFYLSLHLLRSNAKSQCGFSRMGLAVFVWFPTDMDRPKLWRHSHLPGMQLWQGPAKEAQPNERGSLSEAWPKTRAWREIRLGSLISSALGDLKSLRWARDFWWASAPADTILPWPLNSVGWLCRGFAEATAFARLDM